MKLIAWWWDRALRSRRRRWRVVYPDQTQSVPVTCEVAGLLGATAIDPRGGILILFTAGMAQKDLPPGAVVKRVVLFAELPDPVPPSRPEGT